VEEVAVLLEPQPEPGDPAVERRDAERAKLDRRVVVDRDGDGNGETGNLGDPARRCLLGADEQGFGPLAEATPELPAATDHVAAQLRPDVDDVRVRPFRELREDMASPDLAAPARVAARPHEHPVGPRSA